MSDDVQSRAAIREAVASYFRALQPDLPEPNRIATVAWRLSCFDQGARFADYLESRGMALDGMRILDASSAWGGHAGAFAASGARVVAADLNDHEFPALSAFARREKLSIEPLRASCEAIPFQEHSFDAVIALELIEHIPSVENFAREAARVLKPGGALIVSTPPRLRSFVEGEPHWTLRGLAAVPFRLQAPVARRLFGRTYPFAIERQYGRASAVIAPFAAAGFRGEPVIQGAISERCVGLPLIRNLLRNLYWRFFFFEKL